jgi:hypothetical protein
LAYYSYYYNYDPSPPPYHALWFRQQSLVKRWYTRIVELASQARHDSTLLVFSHSLLEEVGLAPADSGSIRYLI